MLDFQHTFIYTAKVLFTNRNYAAKELKKVHVMKTNLMHYLSSVYFVSQPLHISGIFVAHHQEVYCIYTTIGTCYAEKHNMYQLLCAGGVIPPDDGLQLCPKYVEAN